MKNEHGEIINKSQAIKSLDKVRMAHFLHRIKKAPNEYPDTFEEWLDWLNLNSGDTIEKL